jgi:hypothetical protein
LQNDISYSKRSLQIARKADCCNRRNAGDFLIGKENNDNSIGFVVCYVQESMVTREVACMQQAIQFETIIESGIIRIPEQFIKTVPSAVLVTLSPVCETHIKAGANSKAGNLSPEAFSAKKR